MSGKKNGTAADAKQLRARVEYLVGARLRQRDRIAKAVRTQDRIRAGKHGRAGFDVVAAIRASRESR